MANLKITLVKSLNGRLEKHIATAESLGLRKIGQVTSSPTTPRPAARSPRSATCCRLPKLNKEEKNNEAS